MACIANLIFTSTPRRKKLHGAFSFKGTLERDSHQHRINEKTAKLILALSVLMFFAVLILEFFFTEAITALVLKHPLPAFFLQHGEQEFTVGSLFKDKLFYKLACEEIIENGNWFSYRRENTPSFDV